MQRWIVVMIVTFHGQLMERKDGDRPIPLDFSEV
jgi:hypothetical protein